MTVVDHVERAFALLRDEHGRPEPDPALEAVLRNRFRKRRRRVLWPFRTLVVTLGFSCAAFAASGGVDWVRSWWYEVEVEGSTFSETVEGDGERTIQFKTASGTEGSVRVRRDRTESGAQRTRVDILRSRGGLLEAEQAEEVLGASTRIRLPMGVLDEATYLYAGVDARGEPFELYGLSEGANGSRLLALREGAVELPVAEIARLPFNFLSAGARADFTEQGDRGLLISIHDGGSGEVEFLWFGDGGPDAAPAAGAPGISEFETPDGEVRVRVETGG